MRMYLSKPLKGLRKCFADWPFSESRTTSLSESIYNYRREHGRTYHGSYLRDACSQTSSHADLPRFSLQRWQIHISKRRGKSPDRCSAKAYEPCLTSAQREAERLDLQHHLLRITYANKLYFAPLHKPRRCLDVGTGTGIWAIDFADEFPECMTTGIDLSPGQPNLFVSV